jgi:N-acetylneuraminic acid mutarotase
MKNYLSYRSTSARALLALVLFTVSGCLVANAASSRPEATDSASQRTLTFADRVAYQRAVEEVYWQHRIWPKENPGPKPSLDEVMSQQQIQQKVDAYLRNSQLLADQWQRPITPEQLQAEMERMAIHTRQPEVLRELFTALGNDPFIVAECLARPILSQRLMDELHAGTNPLPEIESLGSWATKTATESSVTTDQPGAGYYLPEIASSSLEDAPGGCIDTWTATSTTGAPAQRSYHTAVWTGTEMIIWGGANGNGRLNTGGRYSPSTDSWVATTTADAPDKRSDHTAVWTGTEMIIWGGVSGNNYNTGGRYNPSTDTWLVTTTDNAPEPRRVHTAVWTGSEMIVWGGFSDRGDANNGKRYNPSRDRWVSMTRTDAPARRSGHTAIWTGTEMIVWGGTTRLRGLNTGGRYNPSTDSWVATTIHNAPQGRYFHTAVWTDTGGEMIVWGGTVATGDLDTGGRYNPSTDSWIATTTNNAPDGRIDHTAVWTGSEMVIWGGIYCCFTHSNTGGRYNPNTDSWIATTTTGAPAAHWIHTAVWTGTEMIVWGGYNDGDPGNAGGRYVPCTGGSQDNSQE